MSYLTKQQVLQIIQNAPPEADKQKILEGLIQRGYTLEGFNEPDTSMPVQEDTGSDKSLGGFVGNVFKSGGDFIKNTASAVLHPIKTVKALGNVALGAAEKLVPGQQGAETNFDALTQFFKDRYGSLDALKETMYNDPVGFAADLSTVLSGGAAVASKIGTLGKVAEVANVAGKAGEAAQVANEVNTASKVGNFLSKAADVTNPVSIAGNTVGKVVGKITPGTLNAAKSTVKYLVSQLTGFSPDTVKAITKYTDEFSADNMAKYTREGIADEVKKAIDARIADLRDTGSVYTKIRQGTGRVTLPEGAGLEVLKKYGLDISPEGKILTTAESVPLSPGDIGALEHFIKQYGNTNELSANGFLNAREALSNLSNYEGTTGKMELISRDLRSMYDKAGKAQLKGLSELDAKYSPESKILGQIKKDYLTPDGKNLKDSAINKIANLTGKGKDLTLQRLEEIVPGITHKITVLKAVEDIQAAAGIRVGTYLRAGMGFGGVASANPALIGAAIVSQPGIALPLLRAYGKYMGVQDAALTKILNNTKLNKVNKSLIKKVTVPAFQAGRIKDVTQNPGE